MTKFENDDYEWAMKKVDAVFTELGITRKDPDAPILANWAAEFLDAAKREGLELPPSVVATELRHKLLESAVKFMSISSRLNKLAQPKIETPKQARNKAKKLRKAREAAR